MKADTIIITITYILPSEGGIEGALKKGQAIMSDEKQRDEMIEKVKDTILDFLLKVRCM